MKSLVGNSVIKSNIIKKGFSGRKNKKHTRTPPAREYLTLFPLLLSDACKCSLQ